VTRLRLMGRNIRVSRRRSLRFVSGAALLVALVAACGTPPDAVPPLTIGPAPGTPTVALPTPQPLPKTLIVCTAYEPESLYWYGTSNASAEAVLAAIYDGPVDLVGFQYQSPLLTKMPSMADGDVRVEAVSVAMGQAYLDPLTKSARNLAYGDPYLPSGCTSPDCVRVFLGGEVAMDRMVVEFHLKPALFWSDGEPLTASDSTFSFEVDAHPDTPTTKYLVDRTASYEALDDLTLRWTGIPGFMDSGAAGNFWAPLPEHALGEIAVGDLLTAEASARSPLSYGPFELKSWTAGSEIVLTRNPFYAREAEGLPAFEQVVYRFIGPGLRGGLQQLLTGECDILDESVTLGLAEGEDYWDSLSQLIVLEDQGEVSVAATPGALVEQLTFNVSPGQTSNPLVQPGVRQAVAMCIDAHAVADAAWRGLAGLASSYLPPGHPLINADAPFPATDRDAARAQLEEAGWLAPAGDLSATRMASGAPLQFTLTVAEGGAEEAAAVEIERQLSECGIDVIVEQVPAETLAAAYPNGIVFGGSFQAVLWAWPAWRQVPCELFATSEIPSDAFPQGVNASRFSNATYDQACAQVLLGGGVTAESVQAANETQAILAEDLPTLPLYDLPRLMAHVPDVCGPQADPSISSLLWSMETYDTGSGCAGG
jgi:peptide/nickel transport system substrate-binding protein